MKCALSNTVYYTAADENITNVEFSIQFRRIGIRRVYFSVVIIINSFYLVSDILAA